MVDDPGMARFAVTALRVLFLLAAGVCLAAGFARVADWAIALPASLPCILLSELASLVRYRLELRAERRGQVTEAASRFRFISPAATAAPARKDRVA